ncbi:hypothetical protein MMC31_002465 [Peltigera leucophlebia]|nr:hypothetical protein [Peltigera leucophlebia]
MEMELHVREGPTTPSAPFEEDIHQQEVPATPSAPFEEDIHQQEGPATPSAPFEEDIHQQEQEESPSLRKVLKLLGRWVLTIVFTVLILLVAKTYLAKKTITKPQKATYSLIQTALILALGLNFFEAFKELINVVRRKIGVWAKCDDKERQLMEGINSLLIVCRLLRKSYFKPRIAFFCVAWLAFNLIAQMAVALISLTFSVDDGTDYHDTFSLNGIVNASNLTCYQHLGLDCKKYVVTGHALAHAYGEYGSDLEWGNYTELAEVLNSTIDYPYYRRLTPDKREFAYRFNEYNFDDKQKSYPHFTNRTITIWPDACFSYDVTNTAIVQDINGDGQGLKLSFENKTFNSSINIPNSALGSLSTTYIYRGIKPPEDNHSEAACGDRCIRIWAYTNGKSLAACQIHVSAVSNATQDEHNVPNNVARIAAASIALQGRYHDNGRDKVYTQFQFYAYG